VQHRILYRPSFALAHVERDVLHAGVIARHQPRPHIAREVRIRRAVDQQQSHHQLKVFYNQQGNYLD
jgi:hypothetical protein